MPEKFINKYRIASHRKPGWDYSSNGMYFITLVTQNRVCNLGKVIEIQNNFPDGGNTCVQLSDFGKIVDAEWKRSFEIRKELFLDQYIIMPNHLHAIIVINNDRPELTGGIVWGDDGNNDSDFVSGNVETHGRASLQSPQSPQSPPQRLPKSISSFLAGFKSAVNSKIDDFIDANNLNIPKYNRKNHFFQPNYHDHIIRDDQSYVHILDYIVNNPAKWTDDKFYNCDLLG